MANLADLGITKPNVIPGIGAGYQTQNFGAGMQMAPNLGVSSPPKVPGLGAGFQTQGFDGFNASQAGRQPTYGSQAGAGGGWATDPAQLDYFKNAGANPTSGNIPSYLQNMPGMMQTLGQNASVMGHNEQVADPWATFQGLGSDMAKYQWFNNHPQYEQVIRGNMGAGFSPWYSGVDNNGGAAQASVNTGSAQPSYTQTLAGLGGTPAAPTPALPPASPMEGGNLASQYSSTAGPLSSTATSSNPNTNALMDVYGDPSYQFRLAQGNKSLANNYSARGHFLSGAAAKGLDKYSQDMASQEYGNAYGRMTGDRQYNLDVARGDQNQANIDRMANYNMASNDRNVNLAQGNTNRQFDYNAALQDQTTPFNQQLSLAQLGLSGSNAASLSNAALAQIMSQNITGAGNAGAAGSVGSSNAYTNAISQMLNQYLGQQFVNRIPGLLPNGS